MIRVVESLRSSVESKLKGLSSLLESLQREVSNFKSKTHIYQSVDTALKGDDSLGDFYSFRELVNMANLPPSLSTELATWKISSEEGISRSPVSSSPTTIDYAPTLNATDVGPACIVNGHRVLKGSLMWLREKAYFDGSIRVKFYADSHVDNTDLKGRLGVAFRIKDSENM